SLQLDAVCHNSFIQEQSMGMHYSTDNVVLDYLVGKESLANKDGFCAIPQGPGLGVEIDEAFVEERAKVGHRWRNPLWT
ncbi:enolase C-terminal domain-like protein, partial [Pseudoalteromonas sp. SIMBA_148]